MDYAQLQAFLAVQKTRSFSRAAEQLHLTQPAISKRIAALEQSLNIALFDRIGHTISLTEAGRELRPRAESILQAMEDGRRAITNLSAHITGSLTIGTSHHIGLHYLPNALRCYSESTPDVSLDITFMGSEHIYKAVTRGSIEVGIATLPLRPTPGLALKTLWIDPLSFVVGKTHPLGQSLTATPCRIATLIDYAAILPNPGETTRMLVDQALGRSRFALNIRMCTDYLETIKMLVSVGLGWSVLPNTMLDPSLIQIPMAGLHIQRQLGLIWNKNRVLSNAAKKMFAILDP